MRDFRGETLYHNTRQLAGVMRGFSLCRGFEPSALRETGRRSNRRRCWQRERVGSGSGLLKSKLRATLQDGPASKMVFATKSTRSTNHFPEFLRLFAANLFIDSWTFDKALQDTVAPKTLVI
jgi:hypothetical protein